MVSCEWLGSRQLYRNIVTWKIVPDGNFNANVVVLEAKFELQAGGFCFHLCGHWEGLRWMWWICINFLFKIGWEIEEGFFIWFNFFIDFLVIMIYELKKALAFFQLPILLAKSNLLLKGNILFKHETLNKFWILGTNLMPYCILNIGFGIKICLWRVFHIRQAPLYIDCILISEICLMILYEAYLPLTYISGLND